MEAKVLPFDPSRYRAGFEPEGIALDDVEVEGIGGIKRRLFVGESVWIDPFPDAGELDALQAAFARMATATSDTDNEEALAIMHSVLSVLCLGWNCRDKYGDDLPQPHGNPAAFDGMIPAAKLALLQRVLSGAPAVAASDPKGSQSSPALLASGKARRNR